MEKKNKIVLHHTLDIPGTYYRGIGEVIARMALLEYHLMDAIAELIPVKDPKKKRVLLMSMSISPKLGVLKALSNNWITDGRLRKEFADIISAAQELKQFRHKLAHGPWGRTPNDKKTFHLLYIDEPKDVYLPKSMPITAKELRQIAGAVRALTKRLTDLVHKLRQQPT